jgi:hypothetical protein
MPPPPARDTELEADRARQRIARVAPDERHAAALLGAGLDSAHRIAAMPEHRFVREHAGVFGGDEHAAREAHRRAVHVKALVQHVYANVRDVLSPHVRALLADPVDDATRDFFTAIPDYQELFGSLDALACSHCASIFGPAAYFLDLMRVTDDYITDANTPTRGRSLRERRPDLFELKLTCANTEQPVRSLSIVDSVLSRRIADAPPPILSGSAVAGTTASITLDSGASGQDGAYDGMLVSVIDGTGARQTRTIAAYTGATRLATVAADWAIAPDATSKYRIARDPYAALAAAPYPFNLPWNLPLERTRRCLGTLGTDLAGVYAAFTGPVTTGTATDATADAIKLAASASSVDGAYNAMRIALIGGKGAGQVRSVTAYGGSARRATVAPSWAVVPDATTRYEIVDVRPAMREALGLSIEQEAVVTTPLVTDAKLAPYYGLTTIDLTELGRVETFLARTGLTRASLVELLTQGLSRAELNAGLAAAFFVNATGESPPTMRIVTDATDPNNPFQRISGLTLLRLDRLNRFIRLRAALGWSSEALDWALRSIGAIEIDVPVLVQLAGIQRLTRAADLGVLELCAFWADIKTTGRGDGRHPADLFDRTFNAPAQLAGQDPYTSSSPIPFDPVRPLSWDPASSTGDDGVIRGRLRAALGVSDDDLTRIAAFAAAQLGAAPPLRLDVGMLTWLFRLAAGARLQGLDVQSSLLLLRLVYFPEAALPPAGALEPTVDGALAQYDTAMWLAASPFSVWALAYVIAGARTPGFQAPYEPDDVGPLITRLAVLAEPARLVPGAFADGDITEERSPELFAQLVDAGFITRDGIMLGTGGRFAAAASTFPLTPAALEGDGITPQAATAAFAELEQTDPPLLVTSTAQPPTAVLSQWFSAETDLGFLFAGDSDAPNKRGHVARVLLETRRRIAFSELAPLRTLSADDFVTPELRRAAAERALAALMDAVPPIVERRPAAGEARTIAGYDGETRTVTVAPAWSAVPPTGSPYEVIRTVATGTAQAGALQQITLAAGAPAADDAYDGMRIELTGGTGKGQANTIVAYDGATKVALCAAAWATLPDATTTYAISSVVAAGAVREATATTIELDPGASPTNGQYDAMVVRLGETGTLSPLFTAATDLEFLFASTGAGQSRTISSYTGATRAAIVGSAWLPVPDATSAYRVTRTVIAGTAAGGSSTTIVLAGDASPSDGAYDGMTVAISAGARAGETATISAYTGATRTATVTPAWTTVPDATSSYAVIELVTSGIARGGDATEILLQPDAAGADGAYTGMTVTIVPEPDAGLYRAQVRRVLVMRRQELERVAGVVAAAASVQHSVAMQGLADLVGTSVERLRALIPIATRAADLSDYLAELLTPPAGGNVPARLPPLIATLARARVLFEQLGTSVAGMRGVAELPRAFNVGDVLAMSFADVQALWELGVLERAFGGDRAVVEYLRRPPDPTPPGPRDDALSALTGWPAAQIAALSALLWPDGPGFSDADAGTVLGVGRLRRCFELAARTGLDAGSLLELSGLATLSVLGSDGQVLASSWRTYEQAAALALSSVGARYAGGDLDGVQESLATALDEARRDALLGYAIHLLYATDSSIDSPSALYEYLLIDVEVSGCAMTSPIAQGIGSVQLYMQRCRMMLEPGITDLTNIPEAWWEWLSSYRVWEANRKVFLYPESYLRPAARRGATPAFRQLAQSLLETDITETTVAEILRRYVDDLATVSNLVLCGAYETRVPKPGTSVVQAKGTAVAAGPQAIRLSAASSPLFNFYAGMTIAITVGPGDGERARIVTYDPQDQQATVDRPWKTVPTGKSGYVITGPRLDDTLVLVGRTAAEPPVYHHRRFTVATGWTPWHEIEITIPSSLVAPVLVFDRLVLLWSELKVLDGSQIASNATDGTRSTSLASYSFAVRFASLNPDGTWTAPQTLDDNVVFDYRENYALDQYVANVLGPNWKAYFDDTNVVYRKVYPLHLPADKLAELSKWYVRGDQLIVNQGFAIPWNAQVKTPLMPPTNIPADRRALELNTYELVQRINAMSGRPDPGMLPLLPSPAVDAGMNREICRTVLARYKTPQLYWPALNRFMGTLEIAESETGNVFVDDYYTDDYPGVKMPPPPVRSGTPVRLLGRVAGGVASLTTVTNRPGSFVFDNGDEAFLVRSSDPGLLTISETLFAYAPQPDPGYIFHLESQRATTTDPPPRPAQLRFAFERISTDAGRRLALRLARGGIEDLLSVDAQRTPELPFARLGPGTTVQAPANDQLDFDGAYGPYFWELFFHAPFLIADTLGVAQRFAAAKTWLERIFNPTQQPEPDGQGDTRFWRFLPFRDMTLPSLIETLSNPAQIEAYNDDPLDPDAIARLRIAAYAKAVVIRYVGNLLDWADFLFTQDTREAIDQATSVYVMASDLLGKRPETLGRTASPAPASFDDIKQAYTDRTIPAGYDVQGATPTTIKLSSVASRLDDAYTGYYVTITRGAGYGEQRYVVAYDGATRVATVAAPWGDTLPDKSSGYKIIAHGIPQFLIRLESSPLVSAALDAGARIEVAPFNDIQSYFCVPENDQLIGCWDRVEDRLYKIRHCMNIAGQVRPLPLFAPPINPLELIEGRRAGGSALTVASQVQVPVPKYRFSALLERARAVTAAVSQLGGSLLGALERKDAEALALLQSAQQQQLLDLTTLIKQQQVEETMQTGEALAASLAGAQSRKDYYDAQIAGSLSPAEVANIVTMTLAAVYSAAANAMRAGSAIAYLIPQAGSPFAMTYGGQQIGAALAAGAGVLDEFGVLASFGAQLSATLAQYQRREAEWAMQAALAGHDIDQIEAQQRANAAQLKMVERDLLAHGKAIAQNEAMHAFLKTKFTNSELYQWMAARLAALHFQTYSIALDLARSAQRAYQYELGTDQSFVNFGYWDDGRRGLLAGEGLMLALNQMEQSYLERNVRALEIEKTISLLEVNPRAVLDLIATGECVFELPEKLFDDDYPGHYARRIKTLSVSIPALTGPYQNIHATLTQLSNQLVVKPDAGAIAFLLGAPDAPMPDPETLRSNWWVDQQIALSTGASDDGMFAPAPMDERYLPFEGTGAVSTWRLSMPKTTNRIDFDTISDVVLQLRYTALDGGARLRDQVVRMPAMRTIAGSVFLPLAQRFSSEWYAFLHDPPDGSRQSLEVSLAGLVAARVGKPVITGLFFHLVVPAGISASAGKRYLGLRLGTGPAVDVTFDLNARADYFHAFASPPPATEVEGPASLSFTVADAPPDLTIQRRNLALDPAVIENAVLVVFYEGRMAW